MTLGHSAPATRRWLAARVAVVEAKRHHGEAATRPRPATLGQFAPATRRASPENDSRPRPARGPDPANRPREAVHPSRKTEDRPVPAKLLSDGTAARLVCAHA